MKRPQVAFASNSIGVVGGPSQGAVSGGLTGSTNVGSPIPPGLAINSLNACQASGLLDSTTACTNDVAPDIIEKFALDPGWGHYEVFGLERFFADEVATTAVPNSWSQKVNFGWGVGGSALVPAIPKYLDLQGSVLVGDGIGRYGSSQLPDVTIGTNGSLTPLQTMQFLVGAVAHPWDGLDVYAYAGQEQVNANFWNIGATHGGFGNPAFVNNGCLNENVVSGPAAFIDPIAGTACTANVKRTQEITVGFWQNIYEGGDVGRLTFGMQYEYVRLQAFAGATTQSGAATALGGVPNQVPNQPQQQHLLHVDPLLSFQLGTGATFLIRSRALSWPQGLQAPFHPKMAGSKGSVDGRILFAAHCPRSAGKPGGRLSELYLQHSGGKVPLTRSKNDQ